MNYQTAAKIVCGLLSTYFVVSGITPLFDIDAKLARIGLVASSADGKVAFILIYSSLMVGIGVAMATLALALKSSGPPLILAGVILCCFVVFRLAGSFIIGELTDAQIGYIAVELAELSVVLLLLVKTGCLKQRISF